MLRLFATSAAVCGAASAEAGSNPKDVKTLQEVEQATVDGTYPRTFPHGVLNAEWSNNRKFLRKLRKAIRTGKPFVIKDFLFAPVAEALLQQLQQLSDRQDDDDETGYPFQRLTEGPFRSQPKGWAPLRPNPCTQVVSDFLETRQHRFAFTGHILIGRKGDKHNAWHSAFRQAMEHPAVVQFWQGLAGMPKWVTRYDPSWSWLRPGDFYGLHADDAQARYLAVTIHLASGWSSEHGGELVWCGPEGDGDVTIEAHDRPHFHKSFNVSKGGSALLPSFNVAVVFPVFQRLELETNVSFGFRNFPWCLHLKLAAVMNRNSYHAVAPVHAGDGKGASPFSELGPERGQVGGGEPRPRLACLAVISHDRSDILFLPVSQYTSNRKASKPKAEGSSPAPASEQAPTCEWVEEKTDEGHTKYRNERTGEVVDELPEGIKAADVQKAKKDDAKAPSPTMPLGARPPWQQAKAAAKAPPKPKEGQIWREPGLSWTAKAPPPMPKMPAFLAKDGQEGDAPGHAASLGPAAAKIPAVPVPEPATVPAAEPAADPSAAAEAPAAATSYWTEVRTDEGDIYYHNEETDETAWELPPGGAVRKPGEEAPAEPMPATSQPTPAQPAAAQPAAAQPAAAQPAAAQTQPAVQQTHVGTDALPVPEALKCPLCHDYLDQAVLVVCCGANFCLRCANAAMPEGGSRRCPKCQMEVQQLIPNEDVRKRVDQAFPATYWYPVTADDGQTYFCNWETGEAVWDVPRGGKVASTEAEMQQLHEPQQQPQPQQHQQMPQAAGAWMACQTAEGHVYYYNQSTGESSWDPPPEMATQAAQGGAWDGLYAAHAAEEAARLQRQQYEDALRQMQAAEEAARAQRQQWDQLYAQHFAWYQQQQHQQQQQQAQQAPGTQPAESAASGMVPPSLNASMEEQIAFAMKCSLVQEMEEMITSGASVADRKKALKNWQIKWHPDKNPEQEEVAKTLFQFLADKRSWFLKDPDADVGGWEDLPVESVD
ncbi:RBBP6 [Symbiodinium pilosum]|uniref:RBBP6 protein n=1 Tax=Symbiodinium pilosum TaxID=2952 RepID=A0A812SS39_SYMPI|nr:RBBP6 [Symbiodinium pilosum]